LQPILVGLHRSSISARYLSRLAQTAPACLSSRFRTTLQALPGEAARASLRGSVAANHRQRWMSLAILAGVTWFPGLRRAPVVRHLRVTADVQQVMERLTDSARREGAWLRRAALREGISELRVDRLPDGRLRRRYELAQGRRVWRFTSEDVAITETTIEVVHRVELAGPRLIPVRLVITERVSAEPAEHGTDISVLALGQVAGPWRVVNLLGYRDTITARWLMDQSRRDAEATAAAIAALFAAPPAQPQARTAPG
jgi:hypothetical protein